MATPPRRPGSSPGAWLKKARKAYLERGTGCIEGGQHEFFVRHGELHLDRDGASTDAVRGMVDRAGAATRPAADPEVKAAVERLAGHLFDAARDAEWSLELPRGVELIGPLPLVVFLLAAVERFDEQRLLRVLGGEGARVSTRDQTPALQQLPGLDPDMARLLAQLERPSSIGDLLRGGDRRTTIRALAKLWVVGLVGGEANEDDSGLVPPKLLDRFLERIAETLESTPVGLDAEAHRAEVARLVSEGGELDHYQVLGVERDASEAAILEAFERAAGRTHPSHASKIGLTGKEGTLRVLFERATDAYLNLSDPVRRSSYDTLIGHHKELEIDDDQRASEKRRVARQHYLRGSAALAEMDYSTAVDLLKEAARVDPKPEYFARLGQAQSKNPRWRRHAIESYSRAIELKAGDAGLHLGLAKVLEDEERLDEAREHYSAALELMPDNVDAQVGLERLGGGPEEGGGLRAALARRRS